jgi:prepilin-type processing-associated H-X9-DG protein
VIVAAGLAGVNLFLLVSGLDLSWGPYGERVCALVGLATMAFGITALFSVGGTRFPVTGSIMAAASILIGGFCFLVVPASCRVTENARRADCKATLRCIGLACHIYADDNNEMFPPGFRELYPNYADSARLFKCPSDDSVKSHDLVDGKSAEQKTSYAYVPGLSAAMPAVMILAYDKFLKHHDKQGHESGRNVLWTDAHVEWWPAAREAEFQKLLAEQSAAVEEWRKAHPPVK